MGRPAQQGSFNGDWTLRTDPPRKLDTSTLQGRVDRIADELRISRERTAAEIMAEAKRIVGVSAPAPATSLQGFKAVVDDIFNALSGRKRPTESQVDPFHASSGVQPEASNEKLASSAQDASGESASGGGARKPLTPHTNADGAESHRENQAGAQLYSDKV